MSNVPIPSLTAAISLNGTEQMEAVQSSTSVRVTIAQIAGFVRGAAIPAQDIFLYTGSHLFDSVTEDQGIIVIDSPSVANLTLPQTAPPGIQGGLLQYGSGSVTIVSQSGLLRNYPGVFSTIGLYATAYFYCVANSDGQSAEWVLSGQLA